MPQSAELFAPGVATCFLVFVTAYLIGSIPSAYAITRAFRGLDITIEGSGNAGALNVGRVTGSRGAFALTVLADVLKGLLPTLAALYVGSAWIAQPLAVLWGSAESSGAAALAPEVAYAQCAFAGAVLGHIYSIWMALIKHRFSRTGQGLATGAGALLAYDWRYLAAVLTVAVVAGVLGRRTRVGQVAAAVTLPVAAIAFHSADWPFALLMGAIAYLAAHRQFVALLRGMRPRCGSHAAPPAE